MMTTIERQHQNQQKEMMTKVEHIKGLESYIELCLFSNRYNRGTTT